MDESPASQNGVPHPPQIFINEQPYRSSTFLMNSPNNGLPIIEEGDEAPLDELLRKYEIEGADDPNAGFWTLKLLHHILSEDRILAELKTYKLGNAETYLKSIRPPANQHIGPTTQTYLVTFALLVLLERGDEIGKFIQDKVSDQNLPLIRHEATIKGKVNLCHKTLPNHPLVCFQGWKTHEKEAFERNQWRLLVPYFDLDGNFKAKHSTFDDRTILPRCKRGEHSPSSSSHPSQGEGGYAVVSCIKIHPSCHGFDDVLLKICVKGDLFALKMLHDTDFNSDKQFQNEIQQLQRFNGLLHAHFVTLLATFTFRRNRYFLFPWADGTLEQYWATHKPKPELNIRTARWVSKQCLGIMTAIDIIHNPNHLQNLDVQRYGRHGDIKPDNILWFCSSNDPMGILVISDLGLSSLNRDTSRSNIPNFKIPAVPGYRPPECDVEGGTISRAYDIWTLGCLFLELLTWLLGGSELVDKFEEERKSEYITGSINNIFFDLKKINGRAGYVAQVKTQVTEWFNKMRLHEKCPKFIHDVLDVIENQMLIVLSQDRKRALSWELKERFEQIHLKCMDDSDQGYCIRGVPIQRDARSASVVEANLNDIAKLTISEHRPDLPTHDIARDGEARKSMLPEDLKNMDKILSKL
ncbi:uncharacterized protein BP5553_06834 [Venustampulla echinocandica]|uniref:Protein kinase domain-containing protein n=1 Tax=Venustampulla echinocandica TaxID=2656787 RepID=A0A370TL19_9HELO|nr:uncharacterized protein BP5553_06834 [Venustampulla echinocandica]RDL36222.1 hypothetical protein BP5553_06834 [Venustampulla echinocandica]